jgi:hypothetical protein
MTQETKTTIKRHLISFGITFGATFLLTLYPAIEQANWEASAILGIAFASARSAFKVAWEFAIIPLLTLAKSKASKLKK